MSGKKKQAKPKALTKRPSIIETAPTKLEMTTPEITRKLDLACGQVPREGFEGVDIWEGAKHVVDLQKFPWPFADNSVAEVHSSHYFEHIPMYPLVTHPDGTTQDMLFATFDELWRILIPNGKATIIVPNARSNRGFQDPTHRRFFVAETFLYTFKDWRTTNKLDHYNVKCNFAGDVLPSIPAEYGLWSPEVQARRFNHEWNTIWDWQAKLVAVK